MLTPYPCAFHTVFNSKNTTGLTLLAGLPCSVASAILKGTSVAKLKLNQPFLASESSSTSVLPTSVGHLASPPHVISNVSIHLLTLFRVDKLQEYSFIFISTNLSRCNTLQFLSSHNVTQQSDDASFWCLCKLSLSKFLSKHLDYSFFTVQGTFGIFL